MKTIGATPFARRNLHTQLETLDGAPEGWPSKHLRVAFDIVAKHTNQETARKTIVQAVRAAHRAVKEAARRELGSARETALNDFHANCRALAGFTNPRLRKEIRVALDETTRTKFLHEPVDLENMQAFFSACKDIAERWPEDDKARSILRHLVASKGDVTYGRHLPLQDSIAKIALDYEALPAQARSACEKALGKLISHRAEHLTAQHVFTCLRDVSLEFELTTRLEGARDIIDDYLAVLDGLWTAQGLDVGRGNDPADPHYRSPFQAFAERVLLDQRDPGSRFFTPFSVEELTAARRNFEKIPKTSRENISPAPFLGNELITDWTLRTYLGRRQTFKKKE